MHFVDGLFRQAEKEGVEDRHGLGAVQKGVVRGIKGFDPEKGMHVFELGDKRNKGRTL